MNKKLIIMVMAGILLAGVFLCGCVGNAEDKKSEEIAKAMSPVANGNGVVSASAYISGKGLHPVVVITSSGEYHSWNRAMPKEWQPKSKGETQLVAVLTEGANSLETCEYYGPSVTRYQPYIKADLREAKTGKLVKSTTLYGSVPIQCRQRERMSVTALYGYDVEFSQLKSWMEGSVVS